MKPTAATRLNASLTGLKNRCDNYFGKQFLLVTALLLALFSTFMLGRLSHDPAPLMLQHVQAMRLELQTQQREVDRLRSDNSRNLNALAVRLAELQAASTRLDALGERLAQMGQLTLDEFNFGDPAPIGGPVDDTAIPYESDGQLMVAIDQLGERLRRQSSQLDALQFLMMNRQLDSDLTPTGWPVRKGWISSGYGERNDPFTGERVRHHGLDFAGTRGTDVLAVASGVVTWASKRASYGRTVEIDHGNGYQTRYAHNQALNVRVGDHVAPGQVIASMGATGRASAPHVHFEVLKNGARVNPSRFVRQLR